MRYHFIFSLCLLLLCSSVGAHFPVVPSELQEMIINYLGKDDWQFRSVNKRWRNKIESKRNAKSASYLIQDFINTQFVQVNPGQFRMAAGPIDLDHYGKRFFYEHHRTPIANLSIPFEIQKIPFSNVLYNALIHGQGSKIKTEIHFRFGHPDSDFRESRVYSQLNEGGRGGEMRPVDQLTHSEIDQLIYRLNQLDPVHRYALATEAEWEYVAKTEANGSLSVEDLDWKSFSIPSFVDEMRTSNKIYFVYDLSPIFQIEFRELVRDRFSEHYPCKLDEGREWVENPAGPATGTATVWRLVNERKSRIARGPYYKQKDTLGGVLIGFRLARYKKN